MFQKSSPPLSPESRVSREVRKFLVYFLGSGFEIRHGVKPGRREGVR